MTRKTVRALADCAVSLSGTLTSGKARWFGCTRARESPERTNDLMARSMRAWLRSFTLVEILSPSVGSPSKHRAAVGSEPWLKIRSRTWTATGRRRAPSPARFSAALSVRRARHRYGWPARCTERTLAAMSVTVRVTLTLTLGMAGSCRTVSIPRLTTPMYRTRNTAFWEKGVVSLSREQTGQRPALPLCSRQGTLADQIRFGRLFRWHHLNIVHLRERVPEIQRIHKEPLLHSVRGRGPPGLVRPVAT